MEGGEESDVGLDLMTWQSRPEPKLRVGCPTSSATQAPLVIMLLNA